MNNYHSCGYDHHGDWRINGKTLFLPVEKIMEAIKDKTPQTVLLDAIAWKGMNTHHSDKLDDRYHGCDISYPGVVVEDAQNPANLRYRMIDGTHRMRKILNETSKSHSEFYVLSNEEFLAMLGQTKSQLKDKMSLVTQKEVIDVFGYPVGVYTYKNHDQNCDAIRDAALMTDVNYIQDRTTDGQLYTTRIRSSSSADPLFVASNKECMIDLKKAYQQAINHFYYDVLKYEPLPGEGDPQINQSWLVDYQENPEFDGRSNGLEFHSHRFSFVCGCYYSHYPTEERYGGSILFANPSPSVEPHTIDNRPVPNWHRGMPSTGTSFMSDFENCCAGIEKHKSVWAGAGQIVLWCGTLAHSADITNELASTRRTAIVVNTSPEIFGSGTGSYFYKIQPHFTEGTGNWSR